MPAGRFSSAASRRGADISSGPDLLASQLAALEEPKDAVRVDASASPAKTAEAVVRALGRTRKPAEIA